MKNSVRLSVGSQRLPMAPKTHSNTLHLLASVMFGEARNQGEEGMIAVCHVIMNRARHPSWWGKTISEVILKPYQFSCFNKNDPNYPKISSLDETNTIYLKAIELAARCLLGEIPDPTENATHYHTKAIMPSWAHKLKKTLAIGDHIFYTNQSAIKET